MQEITNPDLTEKALKLRVIAENMIGLCEATLRDVFDTAVPEWKGEASRLFVIRMEELGQKIVRGANNLIYQSNEIISKED